MEVNKEEALRCLHIAQRHRNSSNLPSAIKFARKSVSLYSTPEGEAMVSILQREISVSEQTEGSGSTAASGTSTPNAAAGSSSSTKASGVEEHLSSAKQRAGHAKPTSAASSAGTSAAAAAAAAEKSKKREYTPKQMEVVKRVKACKQHAYYEILSGEFQI